MWTVEEIGVEWRGRKLQGKLNVKGQKLKGEASYRDARVSAKATMKLIGLVVAQVDHCFETAGVGLSAAETWRSPLAEVHQGVSGAPAVVRHPLK